MTSKFSNGRFIAVTIAAVLGTVLAGFHWHVPLQLQAQAPADALPRIAWSELTPVAAWDGEVAAVPAAPLVEGRTAPIEYQSRPASPNSPAPNSATPNSPALNSAAPNSAAPNSASPNGAERSQETGSRRGATAEALSTLRQFIQDTLPERGVPLSVRQAAGKGDEPRGASTGEPESRGENGPQEKSILVQPADQRPRLEGSPPPPAPTPPSQFDPPAVPERRPSDPAPALPSTLAAPGAVTRPYLLSLPESGRTASAPLSVETAQYSNSPAAPAIRSDEPPRQTWSTLSPSAYPSSYPLSSPLSNAPTPAPSSATGTYSSPSYSPSYTAPSYSSSYTAPSYTAPSYTAPSYTAPSYSAPSYSAPSPPALPVSPASRLPIAFPGDRYSSPAPPASSANYYTPSVYTPVGTTPPGSTPQWPASYAPTTSYGARETVLQPAATEPADLRPALPPLSYPYGGSDTSNPSNVRLAPVTSACSVAAPTPYLPGAPPYEVKRGLFNQLIVRVPGQPLRNFFRFVTP